MKRNLLFLCFLIYGLISCNEQTDKRTGLDVQLEGLLQKMTPDKKIGQMSQVNSVENPGKGDFAEAIRKGEIGSVLNEARPEQISEMQRIATEESRLGIPLLFGRDIIHGFKTVFPKNIGMPITFPKSRAQIPVYYANKNTCRPASKETIIHNDDITRRSFQNSFGNTSHYPDIGMKPLYPFGLARVLLQETISTLHSS